MKILIVSVFFPQENTIASHRVYSWAKYWSQMGHDVTVITTPKEKTTTDLKFDLSGFKLHEVALPQLVENFIFPTRAENNLNYNIQNIKTGGLKSIIKKLVYLPFKFILNRFRKYGAFSTLRMPDKFDLWYFPAVNLAKRNSWDLVVSSYGPYVSHLVAYKLKKSGIAKTWIADYRDLWTMNQAFPYGIFPLNLLEEYLEKKINTYADIVTTVSEPLAEKIKNKYHLKNVYTIENGFDFADIEGIDSSPYWEDGLVRMVYSGSIYEGKQDLVPLFQAIANISQSVNLNLLDNFQLIFLGKDQANIVKLVKQFKIEKWVLFMGFLPREEVLRMQRDAHALLFLEFNSCEGIFSGKIFEYMGSGTIIFSVGGYNLGSYVSNFIRESRCGKVLGQNVDLIMEEILCLITNKPVIINSDFVLQYSRKSLAEKMLNLLN